MQTEYLTKDHHKNKVQKAITSGGKITTKTVGTTIHAFRVPEQYKYFAQTIKCRRSESVSAPRSGGYRIITNRWHVITP